MNVTIVIIAMAEEARSSGGGGEFAGLPPALPSSAEGLPVAPCSNAI